MSKSDDRLSDELADVLGKQHVSEQLNTALAATAQQAGALRDALLANGFTREESFALVQQWILSLLTNALQRKKS